MIFKNDDYLDEDRNMNLSDLDSVVESELDQLLTKGFCNIRIEDDSGVVEDYMRFQDGFTIASDIELENKFPLLSILSKLHLLNDSFFFGGGRYYPIYFNRYWIGYSKPMNDLILNDSRLEELFSHYKNQTYSDLKMIREDLGSDLRAKKESIYYKLDEIVWEAHGKGSISYTRKVLLKLLEWLSGSFGDIFEKGMFKLTVDMLPHISENHFHKVTVKDLNKLRMEAAKSFECIEIISYLLESKRYGRKTSLDDYGLFLEDEVKHVSKSLGRNKANRAPQERIEAIVKGCLNGTIVVKIDGEKKEKEYYIRQKPSHGKRKGTAIIKRLLDAMAECDYELYNNLSRRRMRDRIIEAVPEHMK